MDYGQIKQSCPKAYENFCQWDTKNWNFSQEEELVKIFTEEELKANHKPSKRFWRDLYDFFDEQGIYIITKPVVYQLENRILIQCEINLVGIQKDGFAMKTLAEVGIFGAPTRPEAEEAAFVKAFEILEQQLNNI